MVPLDRIVVVNDGRPYPSSSYPSFLSKVIQHRFNQGVSASKNDAFQFLLDEGCEHIFLAEDDIQVVDSSVYEQYISVSQESGILHFNYGYHGPANRNSFGVPQYRKKLSLPSGKNIILNRHVIGAFSYYHRHVLERIGKMDRLFINAYEHVDHTLRIIKADYHPPFWWFADIENSHRMIHDLDTGLTQSIIRKNHFAFNVRVKLCQRYFKFKHGYLPESYPDIFSESDVEQKIRYLLTIQSQCR